MFGSTTTLANVRWDTKEQRITGPRGATMTDEMTSKHNPIGSQEWLQMHAWFPCQHCEESNEPTVHRAVDLKIWDGMTICDECWSNYNQGPIPERWPELDPLEPFKFLNQQR